MRIGDYRLMNSVTELSTTLTSPFVTANSFNSASVSMRTVQSERIVSKLACPGKMSSGPTWLAAERE